MTNEPGKHGGQIILLGSKSFELSVFETGQLPRFRLHFPDGMAPDAEIIEVETVRPDGARQKFAFASRGDFLESTGDIPEPHEFQVAVRLVDDGQSFATEVTFTEEAHGHGHDDHGDRGRSHHGEHGGHGGDGHTHGAVDPRIFTSQRGLWATKWSFIALFVTASVQLAVVLMSHSVALAADMIHNFGDATTAIPLAAAFILARRPPSRRFTYGLGRVEDLAGLFVVLMILTSAIVAGYVAIDRLLNPHPVTELRAVIIASIVGFVGNEGVAIFRIKVGKQINSAALIADGYHARTDGWTSLAVLAGALGVYLGYPMADPIIGLVITAAILIVVWQSIRTVFARMLDGIETVTLDDFERTAAAVAGIVTVSDVRARWLGHRIHAEVTVSVAATLSVADAHGIAETVERALLASNPSLAGVSIHTHPAGTTEAASTR